MPWHDIAIQVRGAIAIDLQRHFVQYWYFAIRDLSDDPKDHLRNFKNRYNELMKL
jgi:phosphatidylserine/phosphatidylglycerophosphate/cardiolipin synthase-like enzyme